MSAWLIAAQALRKLDAMRIPLAPLVIAALAMGVGASAQESLSGSRPNLLFVCSDDHACNAIGAYGATFGATPHLDKLAANGITFTANFCGNALCGPSRASILTGLHSHANGFCRNGNVFDGGQTTFPKLLRAAGYQTAVVGKWHLESEPTGFDHWAVFPDQGQYYNPDLLTKRGRERHDGHATNVATALAIEWLERRDPAKPFLLMCQHKAPHRNWLPAPEELGLYRDGDLPEPATLFDDHAGRIPARRQTEMEIARHLTLHYDAMVPPTAGEQEALSDLDKAWATQRARMTDAQRAAWDAAFASEDAAFRAANPQGRERVRWLFQRYLKNYLRCVRGVDRSVGELLAWLDAHPDVKANTLVVYCSDQGFFLGEHGYYDKRWMDEECFRMPLLVQWPGRIAARKVERLTQNIDFAPTFLELAGVPVPATMHGKSLVPLLAGEDVPWRDAVYYHYYESQATHRVPAMYGVRTATHKLVRYYEPGVDAWELFDLRADPDERTDVARDPDQAGTLATLRRQLAALRTQYGDDTGELLGGTFPRSAGVTRVVPENGGYRVWANAQGGWLLRSCEQRGAVTLTTTLRSVAARPNRNGFVVLAGAAAGAQLVRAGLEFGARRLVILGPDRTRREAAIEWNGADPIELCVDVDTVAHTVVAHAAGARVEAPLPATWSSLGAAGFGGSNTETWFAELVVAPATRK